MRAIVLLSCASFCIAVAACGGSVEPDPTGTSAVAGPLSLAPDGGAEEDAGQSAFFTCDSDTDCVAVNLIDRCCYNGWKIAVAQDEVAAYEEANACTLSHAICPMYIELDRRLPACNAGTHTCEMVPPPDAGNTEPASPPAF